MDGEGLDRDAWSLVSLFTTEEHLVDSIIGGNVHLDAEDHDRAKGIGDYQWESIDFIDQDSKKAEGVHFLLATLAELNTQKDMSTKRIGTFIHSITTRLPEIQSVCEYLEAFAFGIGKTCWGLAPRYGRGGGVLVAEPFEAGFNS